MCIRCIYCNSKKDITISDIIPDSMTSAKFTNKNVCKLHNNLTNSAFENEFSNLFRYFRSQLGYVDRRNGEAIKFKADIYANDELVLQNCSMSSLRDFFETKIAGDGNGNYHLVNVKPEFTKLINPDISYRVNINWVELFLSEIAQKTIAKIAYEFHCYNNDIKQKEARYDNIVNFILNHNDSNPVEIIDDVVFDEITKSSFNYVEGAHGLFEYAQNGKRYIVCSLFGAVWYRVEICDEFESNYDERMYLFLLDGTSEKHENTAIGVACSINGGIGPIQKNLFFNPVTTKIHDIQESRKFLEPRIKIMNSLINGAIITINQLKKYKDILLKIDVDTIDGIELKKILMYQENIKITALLSFYVLQDLEIKSMKEKELLDFFSNKYGKIINSNVPDFILSDGFISQVKSGIENFDALERNKLIIK